MGFYEEKRDGVVKNSLAKYGTAMQLIIPAEGSYNAETGAFTSGGEATVTVQGLIGSFRKNRKGGEAIQAKNRYVYISPSGMKVQPAPGNRLKVASVEYEIVDVEVVGPGGVDVLYQLTVTLP